MRFSKKSGLMSLLTLFVAVVMLQGCTATYPAVATFQKYNEVLNGTVHANLLAGGSDFQLTGNGQTQPASATQSRVNLPG
jgi:hypothetical protein